MMFVDIMTFVFSVLVLAITVVRRRQELRNYNHYKEIILEQRLEIFKLSEVLSEKKKVGFYE